MLRTQLAQATCTQRQVQVRRPRHAQCNSPLVLVLRTQLAQARCTPPRRKSNVTHCESWYDVLHDKSKETEDAAGAMYSTNGAGAT